MALNATFREVLDPFGIGLGLFTIVVGHATFCIVVVYTNVGVANNLPLAAAFATVPVFVMVVYLLLARRAGAFESL
jgi:ABC-type spermidine/putrescine transport system permease subunit I